MFVCIVVYNSHSLHSLRPLVFSLLRRILSLGYSVMPSQRSKPSDSQRIFVFAKIWRLNKAILTAFQEKDNGFDFRQAQRTLKDHFAEAEQLTMYLVDHLPEDITEDFLTNSFTDLQDEIDDTVKKFKQMLKETNQHTDPLEPSQIHDLPAISNLQVKPIYLQQVHCHIFPIRWETNSPIRIHRLHSNLQFQIRRKFQHYQCHAQR